MAPSSAREPRRRVSLRRGAGISALILGLVVMGAADGSAPAGRQPGPGRLAGALAAAPGPSWSGTLSFTPAPGATGVSVDGPVRVTAAAAVLDQVVLAGAGGKRVTGAFDADRRGWRTNAPLAYNESYTLIMSATDVHGRKVTRSSTFTTVKPVNLTLPYLQANAGLLLSNRQTFGVGQPIVVRFDEKVPDRAAAQRALEVVTEPHVDGAWHWFSDREVHWRPPTYWTPGTRVTVNARVYGKDLGNGLYGQGDVSASFTVGPAKVAVADDDTHTIEVWIDGQRVRSIPTAMGRHDSTTGAHGEQIDFRTRSGVHVVLGNERVTRMTSASYGITSGPNAYDERIEWTTHLSYAGEYVHAAPWSVADQGRRDASHGCLNVNTENAMWFYDTFGPGDVVEVHNTGIALDPTDGLGDWTLTWADWLAGSALPRAGGRTMN